MKEITLTIDLLTKYLGEPIRKIGREYEWQCPICMDSHKDNLKFNEEKELLFCFANESHAKDILSDIYKQEHANTKDYDFKPFKSNSNTPKPDINYEKTLNVILNKEKQEEFISYMLKCNEALLNDEKSLNFLYNKRKIKKDTVLNVGLGIDKIKRCWTIPSFKYGFESSIAVFNQQTSKFDDYPTDSEYRLMGFEYRPADLSKNGLTREKDCPTGMAQINGYTTKTNTLIIIEGYFDGYAMYQHLKENKLIEEYHIVTPSNGVQGLLKQIKEIAFNKYTNFELCIDNDETSRPIAEKILKEYPQFKQIDIGDCKDFNEFLINLEV